MASAIDRREARRKRILENCDARLQKITGRTAETNENENENKIGYIKDSYEMHFDTTDTTTCVLESNPFLEEKRRDFLERGQNNDIQDFEFSARSEHYYKPMLSEKSPNHLGSKTEKSNYHIANRSAMSNENMIEFSDCSYLRIFLNPLCYILLALLLNILYWTNLCSPLKMGLIVPHLIFASTKLFFMCRLNCSDGGGAMVGVLILFGVNPQVVGKIRIALIVVNTIFRDLALYVTSFVLFNWLLSLLYATNMVQFF